MKILKFGISALLAVALVSCTAGPKTVETKKTPPATEAKADVAQPKKADAKKPTEKAKQESGHEGRKQHFLFSSLVFYFYIDRIIDIIVRPIGRKLCNTNSFQFTITSFTRSSSNMIMLITLRTNFYFH